MEPKQQKTIVVLGMHRSATSLVAKALNYEVSMGRQFIDERPTAGMLRSNPQGHFEDAEFVELNEAILRAAGGSWKHVPAEQAIFAVEPRFRSAIRQLVAQNNVRFDLWGWKDPRTTLTVRLFAPHLRHPIFVSCLRNPGEVARSLRRRNGLPLERGLRLAKTYNRRLLRFLAEWPEEENQGLALENQPT